MREMVLTLLRGCCICTVMKASELPWEGWGGPRCLPSQPISLNLCALQYVSGGA